MVDVLFKVTKIKKKNSHKTQDGEGKKEREIGRSKERVDIV